MEHQTLRTFASGLVVLLILSSPPVRALSYQTPPALDELTSPVTEAEAGGVGCLVSSLTVGGGIIYLLGGFEPVLTAMSTPMLPVREVLEGSAAVAFIFSSACYIGVALAPLAIATYTAITDKFTETTSPYRPLYSPSELGRANKGTGGLIAPPSGPTSTSSPSP